MGAQSGKKQVDRRSLAGSGLDLHEASVLFDDPRGNGLLIVYKCQVLGGELTTSHEGINPTFFSRHDLPDNLAGGGHNQAILAWKAAEQC